MTVLETKLVHFNNYFCCRDSFASSFETASHLTEYYLVAATLAETTHPSVHTPTPDKQEQLLQKSERSTLAAPGYFKTWSTFTYMGLCLLTRKHSLKRQAYWFVQCLCHRSESLCFSFVNSNKTKTPQLQQEFLDHFTEIIWGISVIFQSCLYNLYNESMKLLEVCLEFSGEDNWTKYQNHSSQDRFNILTYLFITTTSNSSSKDVFLGFLGFALVCFVGFCFLGGFCLFVFEAKYLLQCLTVFP